MSIQSKLNAQAINKLPKIQAVINNSDNFSSNQIKSATIRAIIDCDITIDTMSDKQIDQFEDGLIRAFKYKNWI
tara:strand:- start:33 stop:254 length:222 start_codon:yes stop_codon:yes gene_type:complete